LLAAGQDFSYHDAMLYIVDDFIKPYTPLGSMAAAQCSSDSVASYLIKLLSFTWIQLHMFNQC
jgi:hypothetical protein